MIWSKSFIMERERFDGADVAHLLQRPRRRVSTGSACCAASSQRGWRVLLAHLVLFGYIYPGDAQRIPSRVMDTLTDRLRQETARARLRARRSAGGRSSPAPSSSSTSTAGATKTRGCARPAP